MMEQRPGDGPEAEGSREGLEARIDKLRERIEELERNRPAHGLKPHHVMQIEELEEELERLEARLEGPRRAR